MRLTKSIGLRIARLTLTVVGLGVASLAAGKQANAHHPHFGHGHFGYGHFGHGYGYGHLGYGLGYSNFSRFGYSPFYNGSFRTSYYGFSSPYYYSSYYVAPRYYYTPSCINYNTPFISFPVNTYYYQPTCSTFFSSTNYGASLPIVAATRSAPTWGTASWPTVTSQGSTVSRNALATLNRPQSDTSTLKVDTPLMMRRDRDDSQETRLGVKYVANKPAVLQPYSPVWTKAAVGIVDDMISEGRLEHAHSSCRAMEKIEQAKGAGVYLRQALLNYFDPDTAAVSSTDEVLGLLNTACAAGSQLQPNELGKASLEDYFSACSVDVGRSMEKLCKTILDNPNKTGREVLLLTALLKIDGQADRAKLFAGEAEELAASSGSFHWHNLLAVCKE